jgi:hypothetical protein
MFLSYKNSVESRLGRRTLETDLYVGGPGYNFREFEVEFMFRKIGTGEERRTKCEVAKLLEKKINFFSSNINLAYFWVYLFRNKGSSDDRKMVG